MDTHSLLLLGSGEEENVPFDTRQGVTGNHVEHTGHPVRCFAVAARHREWSGGGAKRLLNR